MKMAFIILSEKNSKRSELVIYQRFVPTNKHSYYILFRLFQKTVLFKENKLFFFLSLFRRQKIWRCKFELVIFGISFQLLDMEICGVAA
jgi:hypothetical protein